LRPSRRLGYRCVAAGFLACFGLLSARSSSGGGAGETGPIGGNKSDGAPTSCAYAGDLTGLASSYPNPVSKALRIGWLDPIGANEAANAGQAAAKKTERLGCEFAR